MKTAILTLMAAAAGAQAPPSVLIQALKELPGVSILQAPIDAKSLADLKDGGYWPPWSTTDLDGDGVPDMAAVVVQGHGANRSFGVIALHSRTPGAIQWVVPMGKDSITGLDTKQPPNAVVPLFCFYCDGNAFFRWSGTAYEMELRAAGEEVTLLAQEGLPMRVFLEANKSSKIVAQVEPCTKAKVADRSGTSAATRWYLIETGAAKKVRGWIPGTSVMPSTLIGECIG